MNTMRRRKQELPLSECLDILKRGTDCTLALAGSPATDGFPYALPINYTHEYPTNAEALGCIYTHCAQVGTKIQAIEADNRVSLAVIDANRVVPERYTTHFRSVIAFGRAHVVTDDAERHAALVAMAEKYAPLRSMDEHEEEIQGSFERTCVLRIDLDHVTGKQARELAQGIAEE